jgi:hypothetical protein
MRRSYLYTAILILATIHAGAQNRDSLDQFRLFLRICNAYKKIPLKLDLTMRNTANLVLAPEDTLQMHAVFYLQEKGSYIQFGELEQLADDSLLLIVSNKMKRMLVYAHSQSVAAQLKKMLGPGFGDSSLSRMVAKYSVSTSAVATDSATIELTSRITIFHTGLPTESVMVKYDRAALQPFEVRQTRRSLIPISKDEYRTLSERDEYKNRLLSGTDSSFYVIREQVTTFSYEGMSHRQEEKLPAKISDRIAWANTGKYIAVGAYADFLVTQDL